MKIRCLITEVEANTRDFDDEFFESITLPEVNTEVIVERFEDYPFEENGYDSDTLYSKGQNGNFFGPFIYTTYYKQLQVIDDSSLSEDDCYDCSDGG